MKTRVLVIMVIFLSFVSANTCFAGDNGAREEVIATVKAAVKMAQEQGRDAALAEIANPHGKFVKQNTYVFALNPADAMTLAHPIKPKLVGKNLLHVKDVNGVMLFVEFAKVAKSPEGKGWVDYMWPKPGEKKPSPKHTYLEKVPGEDLLMAAGYYE